MALTYPTLSTSIIDRTYLDNELLALLLGGATRGDQTTSFAYDGNGRLNQVDVVGEWRYSLAIAYDSLGRVLTETISIQHHPPFTVVDRTVVITYTYDGQGRITSAVQAESV
jgi:hypothetical protein